MRLLHSEQRPISLTPTLCTSIPCSSSTPSVSSRTPSAARALWPRARSWAVAEALGKHALPRCRCTREQQPVAPRPIPAPVPELQATAAEDPSPLSDAPLEQADAGTNGSAPQLASALVSGAGRVGPPAAEPSTACSCSHRDPKEVSCPRRVRVRMRRRVSADWPCSGSSSRAGGYAWVLERNSRCGVGCSPGARHS